MEKESANVEGTTDWTKPVDGVINVPDELDPLIKSMMFQYGFHKHSKRFGPEEMVCRMAKIAQIFFKEMYISQHPTEQDINDMAEMEFPVILYDRHFNGLVTKVDINIKKRTAFIAGANAIIELLKNNKL